MDISRSNQNLSSTLFMCKFDNGFLKICDPWTGRYLLLNKPGRIRLESYWEYPWIRFKLTLKGDESIMSLSRLVLFKKGDSYLIS